MCGLELVGWTKREETNPTTVVRGVVQEGKSSAQSDVDESYFEENHCELFCFNFELWLKEI